MRKEARAPEEIIEDILAWRGKADGLPLEQHIVSELEKLKRKTIKSRNFKEQYEERSGELVTTMTFKMLHTKGLLEKWRNGDRTIGAYDKFVLSDMLEFIINPFKRFATSASETLNSISSLDAILSMDSDLTTKTHATLTQNKQGYDSLRLLLVELCDSVYYAIPNNVRHGEMRNNIGIS